MANATPINPIDPEQESDNDLWSNQVEVALGSDPNDPASTPESIGGPERYAAALGDVLAGVHLGPSSASIDHCRDGIDNDLDGKIDRADDNNPNPDPGCNLPVENSTVFPSTGTKQGDSSCPNPVLGCIVLPVTLATERIRANTSNGVCWSNFIGRGPIVVQNNNPLSIGGGLSRQDFEIVALQASGEDITTKPDYSPYQFFENDCIVGPWWNEDAAHYNSNQPCSHPAYPVGDGNGNPACGAPFPTSVTAIEDPTDATVESGADCPGAPGGAKSSPSCFVDTNSAPGSDYPATTYQDLFTWAYNSTASTFAPTYVNGHPLKATGITQIPNYCSATCNPFPGPSANPDCMESDDGKSGACVVRPKPGFTDPSIDRQQQVKIKAPKFTKLTGQSLNLDDQLHPAQTNVSVIKPTYMMAPVQQTGGSGGGIVNSNAYLKCYSITVSPKPAKETTSTTSQWGSMSIALTKPVTLCRPARLNGSPDQSGTVNNYECYQGTTKTAFTNKVIAVTNTVFGAQTALTVKKGSVELCAPVKVNGGSIPNPSAAMLCYKTSGGTGFLPQNGMNLDTAYGNEANVNTTSKKGYKFCDRVIWNRPDVNPLPLY